MGRVHLSTCVPSVAPVQALCWFVRWRLFYLACSELFAYDGGNEWGVVHMLFKKR